MRFLLPERYRSAKVELVAELDEVNTCSITTTSWSSTGTQTFITVTCHFLSKSLKSHVLPTYQVMIEHTADNIAAELKKVADEWGITDKVTCVVTDNTSNMKAAVCLTGWRHLPCFAHALHLIVQEATEEDQELCQVHHKARSIVTFLKTKC